MAARRWLPALLLGLAAAPAPAAVTVTFYSHEGGEQFPHAFLAVHGTLDADGSPVDANYGFSAVAISPAILIGSVRGEIERASPAYVAASDARLALTLADADYWRLMALARDWYYAPGATYNLNRHNCVHFVAAAARTLGLDAPDLPGLMKRPGAYLDAIAARNAARLGPRAAAIVPALTPSP